MARGRTRDAVARRMEDLASRREALDAELAERRERENAVLERWAGLAVQREEIDTAHEAELARLDAARARARADSDERVAVVEAEQAAVVLQLHRNGRTVDQLVALLGLSDKVVRAMLRVARPAVSQPTGAQAADPTGARSADLGAEDTEPHCSPSTSNSSPLKAPPVSPPVVTSSAAAPREGRTDVEDSPVGHT